MLTTHYLEEQEKGSKGLNLQAIHKYIYASKNKKTIPESQSCSHFDNTRTWDYGDVMKWIKLKVVVNNAEIHYMAFYCVYYYQRLGH